MHACSGGDFVGVSAFRGQKCWIPWSWSYGGWSCLMWVLRPELRSSARAVCTLNHSRSIMTFDGLLMALLCHQSPKHLVDMLRAMLSRCPHHPFPTPQCFPNSANTEPPAGTVNTQGLWSGGSASSNFSLVPRWMQIQRAHSETTDIA